MKKQPKKKTTIRSAVRMNPKPIISEKPALNPYPEINVIPPLK
jgi:hypothetical protein